MDEAKEKVEYLIECYSQKSGPQVYAVLLKDGTYIGHVQAVFMDDGSWEIGYHVGYKHTGKGYASEAVKAFLPVIMKRLGITEMKGICALDNLSSIRVMEKNGFIPSTRLLDQKVKNYVYYLSPLDRAALL